jgi:hypothetical protein
MVTPMTKKKIVGRVLLVGGSIDNRNKSIGRIVDVVGIDSGRFLVMMNGRLIIIIIIILYSLLSVLGIK